MSFWDDIRGIVGSLFQLGLSGPNLKNNSGAIEARNAADSAFVNARGLAAVAANDFVILGQIPSIAGLMFAIRFPVGIAATTDAGTLIPANAIVSNVELDVQTAYSPGTTIEIGQAGSLALLQTTAGNNPLATGEYDKRQDTPWGGAALAPRVTIAGGPLVGASFCIVHYSNPNP